jgi:hypothetical protein
MVIELSSERMPISYFTTTIQDYIFCFQFMDIIDLFKSLFWLEIYRRFIFFLMG